MRHALMIAVFALTAAGAGAAADARNAAPQGKPIPYRVIPMESLAATVKNWSGGGESNYAIITNLGEWQLAFQPTVVMGNQKPTQPDPGFFRREQLVAISRITDAPSPGEKILAVKSLVLVDGEPVLTYTFVPPAKKASYTVKNTLLLAIPVEFHLENGIRIIEELETPTSLATQAELEEAKRLGRVKPKQ